MQQRPTLSTQLIRGNSVPELVSWTGPEQSVRGPVCFLSQLPLHEEGRPLRGS